MRRACFLILLAAACASTKPDEAAMVLRVHPVADLAPGAYLVDEKPVPPNKAVLALIAEIRSSVAPGQWPQPAHIASQGNNLVVCQTPAVQDAVARYLEALRVNAKR